MLNRLKNILVVEDDVASCYLIKCSLHELNIGEKISFKSNGSQAIKYMDERQGDDRVDLPDLLLVNITEQKLNGLEFLTYCQKEGYWKGKDIKVIFLTTTRTFYQDLERAKAFNTTSFLLKPVTTDNLLFALML
jgi:CheY-like chemotaxis protein